MKEIISDWCQFCEGKKEVDKSYFYTLFWEDINRDDLNEIFKYFPYSDKLFEIMSDYLFSNGSIINQTNNELIKLVQKDILEKISLTDNLKHIRDYPIEYIENYNFVKDKIDSDEYYEYYDEIADIVADNWLLEDKKCFALYEAFYGLTKNYEIVWYLFSPLINTSINYKYYFDIITYRGIYTIYNKKILVSKEEQNLSS